MNIINKKLIIFYDDGIKVVRKDILVLEESEHFIGDELGHYYNKLRIIRMEEKK